jgi:hypothetical protein
MCTKKFAYKKKCVLKISLTILEHSQNSLSILIIVLSFSYRVAFKTLNFTMKLTSITPL